MTKLAVINCKTLQISGFDGKVLVSKAIIGIDPGTTPAGLKEVINDFRLSCSAERMQADRILSERHAYAEKEVPSWGFPNARQ